MYDKGAVILLWLACISILFFYALIQSDYNNAICAFAVGSIVAIYVNDFLIAFFDYYGMGYYPRKMFNFLGLGLGSMNVITNQNNLSRHVEIYKEFPLFGQEKLLLLYHGEKVRPMKSWDVYCMRCHNVVQHYSKLIVYEEGSLCHDCNLSDKLYSLFLFREVIDGFGVFPQELCGELMNIFHYSCIDQFVYDGASTIPEYFQFIPVLPPYLYLGLEKYVLKWNELFIMEIELKTGRTLVKLEEEVREFENFHQATRAFLGGKGKESNVS